MIRIVCDTAEELDAVLARQEAGLAWDETWLTFLDGRSYALCGADGRAVAGGSVSNTIHHAGPAAAGGGGAGGTGTITLTYPEPGAGVA